MKILLVILTGAISLTINSQQSVDYQVKNKPLPLLDHPDGKILARIPKHQTVTLLAFNDQCSCFSAAYNEIQGFLPSGEWLTDVFPKIRKQQVYIFPDEKVKSIMNVHNLVLETNENGAFVLARKPLNEANVIRAALMIRKYGYTDGKRVADGKLWLGMKAQMTLDSWGIPYRVKRSRGNWGELEQWIYSSAYLYFENGQLTEILKITSATK
jgi:hypothetical protein